LGQGEMLTVVSREYEIAQLVCCSPPSVWEGSFWREDGANGERVGKLGDEQRAAVAAADGCAESLAGAD
jgi:hypothetical protein